MPLFLVSYLGANRFYILDYQLWSEQNESYPDHPGLPHARKTPANADLIDGWSIAMETQLNVAVGDGEPVEGKRSTFSNGTNNGIPSAHPRMPTAIPIGRITSCVSPLPTTPKGSA